MPDIGSSTVRYELLALPLIGTVSSTVFLALALLANPFRRTQTRVTSPPSEEGRFIPLSGGYLVPETTVAEPQSSLVGKASI